MLFKVSFKETKKEPSKVIEKAGGTTIVTLRGVVDLPEFWCNIPKEIHSWISGNTKVELYENIANNTLIIFSQGISRCMDSDKYDSLLGERLAEARAKYIIYKFFYDLTFKLYNYYDKIMFGDQGVVCSGTGSCIAQDIKKYEGLCIRESHHIGELLKSEENE
jgi:hypothetical protein